MRADRPWRSCPSRDNETGSARDAGLYRFGFVLAAIAVSALTARPSPARDLAPTPPELMLVFGRDFCELSARLIDREAKLVAGTVYHHFPDLLADKTLCRKPR
jgi:hypothetical protein